MKREVKIKKKFEAQSLFILCDQMTHSNWDH